jgi:hypothetical protein
MKVNKEVSTKDYIITILYEGKVLEVVDDIKKEITKEIKNIELNNEDFDCDGVEQTQSIVNDYLELINTIYQDLITEYIDRNDKIYITIDGGEYVYGKEV